MASLSFIILGCLLGASFTQAQDHICCGSATVGSSAWSTDAGSSCKLDNCNKAMSAMASGSLPDVIEFLVSCNDNPTTAPLRKTVTTCAAPLLDRSLFMDLLALDETSEVARSRSSIAAVILGLGCAGVAQASDCTSAVAQALSESPAPTSSPPTSSPPTSSTPEEDHRNNTFLGQRILYNPNILVRECLVDTAISVDFDNSRFGRNGMSECAAVGTDTTPVPISQIAVSSNSDCQSMVPCTNGPSSPDENTFCLPYFSSAVRGKRCGIPTSVDRMARAFHNQWRRKQQAQFGTRTVAISTPQCFDLLERVACETSMGVCPQARCRNSCENDFIMDCGTSIAVARDVCAAIGANSTSSANGCTEPRAEPTTTAQATTTAASTATGTAAASQTATTTTAPAATTTSSTPREARVLSSSLSNTNLTVTFNVVLTADEASKLTEQAFAARVAERCESADQRCELLSVQRLGFNSTNSTQLSVQYKVFGLLSASHTQAIMVSFGQDTANSFTVQQTVVPAMVLASSNANSGSSAVAASALAVGLLGVISLFLNLF